MKREDLLAPEDYNLVVEFEKYIHDEARKAIVYENENGNTDEITYAGLIKKANKVANVFTNHGLKKVM